MNRKEEELHRIVELTVLCCNTSQDGQDIGIDDILGKSRRENLVMARCILVSQMIRQGYSSNHCIKNIRKNDADDKEDACKQ